jgi:hypothetical protein
MKRHTIPHVECLELRETPTASCALSAGIPSSPPNGLVQTLGGDDSSTTSQLSVSNVFGSFGASDGTPLSDGFVTGIQAGGEASSSNRVSLPIETQSSSTSDPALLANGSIRRTQPDKPLATDSFSLATVPPASTADNSGSLADKLSEGSKGGTSSSTGSLSSTPLSRPASGELNHSPAGTAGTAKEGGVPTTNNLPAPYTSGLSLAGNPSQSLSSVQGLPGSHLVSTIQEKPSSPGGTGTADKAVSVQQRGGGSLKPREVEEFFSALENGLAKNGLMSPKGPGGCHHAKELDQLFASGRNGGRTGNLSLAELEGSFFSSPEIEKLLASFAGPLSGTEQQRLGNTLPDERPPGKEGKDAHWLPLCMNVVLCWKNGKPLDPKAQLGFERLQAYAWSSIYRAEAQRGMRFVDPEDIVHDIYVEWRKLVVRPEDEALSNLLDDASEEMSVLRTAVARVIARTRYRQNKWTRRVDVQDLVKDAPALSHRGEQERVDWEDWWKTLLAKLTPQEKQILELRKQEKTFAEIGAEMGMAKQRVWEIWHAVVTHLQENYRAV